MNEFILVPVNIEHVREFTGFSVYANRTIKRDFGFVAYPKSGIVSAGCGVQTQLIFIDPEQELTLSG